MIIRYQNQGAGLSVAQIQAEIPPAFTVSAAVGTPPGFFDVTVTPDPDAAAHADLDDYMAQQGLVFVEDNPTTPLSSVEILFPSEYNNNYGDYSVRYVSAGGSAYFSFRVPADFVSLHKLVLVGIPQANMVNQDIDLSSDYGGVGEPFNAHSESDTTSTFSATSNQISEFDISTVFSALSAGDSAGLFIDHNTLPGPINYLGILLDYSTV